MSALILADGSLAFRVSLSASSVIHSKLTYRRVSRTVGLPTEEISLRNRLPDAVFLLSTDKSMVSLPG
jgi:hypothetical protein